MRNTVWKVLIAASLIGCIHWIAVSRAGWRASLGETNFQNNMIRVDSFVNEPPSDVALVGSSISGRLLPSYFPDDPNRKYVNLGLDGCTLLTGLEMIKKTNQRPRIVLLECMRDVFEPGANHDTTLNIMENPVFRAGRWMPILRPSWRPSSILYTRAKLTRERKLAESSPELTARKTLQQAVIPAETSNATRDPWKTKTIETINELAGNGIAFISLRIPSSRESVISESRPYDFGDLLFDTEAIPVIDTVQVIRERGIEISFTDEVHLQSESARVISQIISDAVTARSPN
jgi:hypothetical protein